jgi:hypothetical protein
LKIAAGLRTVFVNRAEVRDRIESDAGAITLLVHAKDPIALGDQMVRDAIRCPQFNHQMAAKAAAGAGGEIDGKFRHGPRMQKLVIEAMGE